MDFAIPSLATTSFFLLICFGIVTATVFGVWRSYVGVSPRPRLMAMSVALGILLWLLILGAVVRSGILMEPESPLGPPRLVLFFLASNLVALVFAMSPIGTHLAEKSSFAALIFFQTFRLPLELILHQWATDGVIPSTMTWTGQNYDVFCGAFALIFGSAALIWRKYESQLSVVFSVLGIGLLLNVARVAMMSSPLPFAWPVEPKLRLVFTVPHYLIAPVCVAGALAAHILLVRKLVSRSKRNSKTDGAAHRDSNPKS